MYTLNSINSSTLFDYSYTYHYSKYSCSTIFYFIHVVFCYLIFFSGLGCFITRLHDKMKPAHSWFGRIYILTMLYATASSLLIHNTGLPLAVLISFCYCIGGLTIAWILILLHKMNLENKARNFTFMELIGEISENLEFKVQDKKIGSYIDDVKVRILKNRTLTERVFSYKTFHGIFMFLSWFNITGRIFASDQSGDFECYTYPIYKVGNQTNISSIEFTLVPEEDPNYSRLPWAANVWGWYLGVSLGPIIVAFLVGLVWSCVSYRKQNTATV